MQTTVDSESELFEIKDLCLPEAKRENDTIESREIRCVPHPFYKITSLSTGSSYAAKRETPPAILSLKFGSQPYSISQIVRLIQLTKDLTCPELTRIQFPVGAGSPAAYNRRIALCKRLITIAKTIGCDNVQLDRYWRRIFRRNRHGY